jgi:Zn-dependent protease
MAAVTQPTASAPAYTPPSDPPPPYVHRAAPAMPAPVPVHVQPSSSGGAAAATSPSGAAGGLPALLSKSFAVGSITGIKVRVHALLPVVTALYSLSYGVRLGGLGVALGLIVFGPLLWLTVLFHELWHCWAAKAQGIPVDQILLWPLGGLAFIGQSPTPCADMGVAFAGPLSHVPQVLIWLGFLVAANGGSVSSVSLSVYDNFGSVLCYDAMIVNGSMAVFNLCIPCYPLDGGRILADALLQCGIAPALAAMHVVRVSVLILIAFFIYGIWVLVETGAGNGLLLLLIAGWMALNTKQLNDLRAKGQAHMHPLFASAAIRAERTDGRAAPLRV